MPLFLEDMADKPLFLDELLCNHLPEVSQSLDQSIC